ncbi:MAG: ankyrin repeat domain-containing protein [Thermodesulfobacteriota bacterium]
MKEKPDQSPLILRSWRAAVAARRRKWIMWGPIERFVFPVGSVGPKSAEGIEDGTEPPLVPVPAEVPLDSQRVGTDNRTRLPGNTKKRLATRPVGSARRVGSIRRDVERPPTDSGRRVVRALSLGIGLTTSPSVARVRSHWLLAEQKEGIPMSRKPTPSTRWLLVVALVLALGTQAAHADSPSALDLELIEAAQKGDGAEVKSALDKGANPNAVDDYAWTALMASSWRGDVETAKLLLEKGADVNSKNKFGRTALMRAAEMGHLATVKLLLEKGADVNASEPDGWTALMDAINSGRADVVKLLLEKRARFDPADDWGKWAWTIVRDQSVQIARLLKRSSSQ